MNNWSESNEERGAAWAAIQRHLYQRGLLTDSETATPPWDVEFIRQTVANAPAQMKETASVSEYVERVTAWVETQYPPLIGGTITVSHGPVSVTAIHDADATLRSQIISLQRRLTVAVDALNITPLPATGGKNTVSMAEEHPVTALVHEYQNGKHAYKLKGGPFEKFGVRIWPEVLSRAGFQPETLELGEFPASGTMTIEIFDGKPRKVTSVTMTLDKAEQQVIPF